MGSMQCNTQKKYSTKETVKKLFLSGFKPKDIVPFVDIKLRQIQNICKPLRKILKDQIQEKKMRSQNHLSVRLNLDIRRQNRR